MVLKRAHLYNYRNYKNSVFNFEKGINLIIGKNAQGKTNLIEAIYIGAVCKAFRTNRVKEIIRYDETKMQIGLLFINDKKNEFYYKSDSNKLKIELNGELINKRHQIFGLFPMAIFYPDYLKIVKDSPMFRRRFIDKEISLMDKLYLSDLINYNKLINEKNIVIKKEKIDEILLDSYDEKIAYYGTNILKKRIEFINFLKQESNIIHKELSLEKEDLKIEYKTFLKEADKNKYLNLIKEKRKNDIKVGYSTTGIHTDDILFFINENNIKNYGSQGQIRLTSLSVFFALIKYIENKSKIKPIVLLDDAFSELDRERKKEVIKYLENYQSFITATDIEVVGIKEEVNIIKIDNGGISE